MTITKENSKPKDLSFKFNRFLYGGLVILGLYFLLFNKDISTAMCNLGIALAFDPFDQKIVWQNRPSYQKIWLIVHLSIVLVLLGILMSQRF